MMLDAIIRKVANNMKPNSSLEERFELRKTISELVEWQKNNSGIPINKYHTSLLAEFNAEYRKEIRREITRIEANYNNVKLGS